MLDTTAASGPASQELEELAVTVRSLDATVGQMATLLTNLIHLLQQQQDSR
jgi:hypothetical protein